MITLKDYFELVNYRITEGSEYCWNCYGTHAYRLDYWNEDHNGHSVSIVFDTRTQTVYEVSVYDYKRDRAYRLVNPNFVDDLRNEATMRNIDNKVAWDDVDYVDLEVDQDFIKKCQAIINGEEYDTKVEVPLEIDDDTLFRLMKMAHERDITLNQMVEEILRVQINSLKV